MPSFWLYELLNRIFKYKTWIWFFGRNVRWTRAEEIWTNTNFTVQVSTAFSVNLMLKLAHYTFRLSIWNRNAPGKIFAFERITKSNFKITINFREGGREGGGGNRVRNEHTKPNKTLAQNRSEPKSIECKQNGKLALLARDWGSKRFVWSKRAPIHHQISGDRIVLQLSFYCINSAIVHVFISMLQSIFRCGWFVQCLHLIVNNGNCWMESPRSVLIFMAGVSSRFPLSSHKPILFTHEMQGKLTRSDLTQHRIEFVYFAASVTIDSIGLSIAFSIHCDL